MSNKHTFKTWKTIKYSNGKISKSTGQEMFFFETTKNGKPIKLGDGGFGVVYRVKSVNGEKSYALKLFYNRDDQADEFQGDATKERFLLELKYLDNIRRKWNLHNKSKKNISAQFKPKGVIEPYAATAEFLKSVAFKNLFSEGDLQSIKVANYAIVMPLYDGTLKDLLETKEDNKLTGYDALRKADFNLRSIAMLPILQTLVSGLKTLYIGDYKHLDIKPANIFYLTDGFKNLEFVLADMGYLNTKGKNAPSNQTLLDEEKELDQLLGTRHYRSPEQIDYFDRCDARVEVDNNQVILKISDPKFHDSIIEKNDILFFSKSKNRYTYTIQEYIPPSNGIDYVTLKITVDQKNKEKILPENKTHIEFRKRQSIKTDLFGVAAIAYDFITGGKSPERFYERIRNLDTENNSINSIMQRYKRLKAYKTNDQEIQHIFKPLKFDNKYPDPEIIKFILKCMLYNVKDTYADTFANQIQYKIFDEINKDLDIIHNAVDKKVKKDAALNVTLELLVRKNDNIVDGKNVKMTSNPQMSDTLDFLGTIDNQHFYWRLAAGIKHLRMLIHFVQDEIFQSNGKDTYFFAEIYSENLSILKNETKLKANDIAYNEEREYLDDIKRDNVLTKIFTDYTDFFVPENIPYIRQPMRILPAAGQIGGQIKCKYNFLSRSFLGEQLKSGDWVIYQKDDIPRCLYKVVNVKEKEKEMILERYRTPDNTNENDVIGLEEEISQLGGDKPIDVVYYHNIDRLNHYLQLLGTYIQHLFFAGQGKSNHKTTPKIIKLIQNKIMENYEWNIPVIENPVTNIYYQLAYLFAKLILVNDKNSFYHKLITKKKNELQIMIELKIAVEKLERLIENTLFITGEGFIDATRLNVLETNDYCKNELKPEVSNQYNEAEVNFENILAEILIPKNNQLLKSKRVFDRLFLKFKQYFKSFNKGKAIQEPVVPAT